MLKREELQVLYLVVRPENRQHSSALEHEEVIDIAVECSNVPVIAGTGSNNTGEALQFTKHAEDAGVDAVLLISPYYNKPNPAGLLAHFKKIAEAVNIPIILYNVPS